MSTFKQKSSNNPIEKRMPLTGTVGALEGHEELSLRSDELQAGEGSQWWGEGCSWNLDLHGGEGEMSGGLLTVEVAQGSLCLGSGLWGLKAEGCLGLAVGWHWAGGCPEQLPQWQGSGLRRIRAPAREARKMAWWWSPAG